MFTDSLDSLHMNASATNDCMLGSSVSEVVKNFRYSFWHSMRLYIKKLYGFDNLDPKNESVWVKSPQNGLSGFFS